MATADKHVNLSVNRILGVDRFKANFLDYLRAYDQDIVASVFACSGVFDALGLAADGNDKFKITGFTGKGIVGLDGAGNFLDLDARSADFETVQFENENAVDYHVGLKGEVLPESLAVSPVDGLPHWDRMEEIAGWEGTPDSVVDNGDGTMTLKVNAVTESGPNRSGAGRQVAVYKKTIEKSAVTYAKALEICTVAWDAADNKITTTTWAASGAGVFGQDTPSTTASDYTVVSIGPRVSRNTDLSTVAAWCYVGFVTGAGAGNPPAVFDVTGQNVMNIPLSDFTQITRYENVPPDRLKIDVKAIAAEEGTNTEQIRVSGWDGVGGQLTVFSVDELGNVDIKDTATIDNLSVNDAAGKGVTANLVPSGDGSLSLGNWVWGADTGYRWSSLLATELAAIKASEPSMYLRKTGIAANEKTWRFHIDAGDDLVLETMDDIPASGVSVLKVTRGVGTAVAQIDIYKPTYMGATIFTQTVAPISQHNYYIGAYGGDEFLEMVAKDFVASHNSPRFIMRENDQIGTGVDRENWGIIATGGDLAIVAYNAARTLATEAIHINRAAGNSYAIDSIDFPVPIRTTTYPLIAKGSAGNTFKSDLYSQETGLGADEKRWRWTTTDDGNGDLKLVTVTDAGGAGVDVLKVARGPGTAIGAMAVSANIIPTGVHTIGEAATEWTGGYFSGSLRCLGCHVDGDSGGVAGTTTLTSGWSGVSSGAGSIVMNSANPGTNTGWISIRVGAALKWIPYWDTNAP